MTRPGYSANELTTLATVLYRRRMARLLAATALSTCAALPALAQTPPPATAPTVGIQEVVVTAEKHEEKLIDVPIAIAAFSAQALETRNIVNISDLNGFAPGVITQPSPGYRTESDIGIRGTTTLNPAMYWQPAVGVYVDGVYIAKAEGNVFNLPNISDLEILKGPQGTLYGRNTLEGAVVINTKKPTGELDGMVEYTVGNYGLQQTKFMFDLPKVGPLSVQIAGLADHQDGFYSNNAEGFPSSSQNRLEGNNDQSFSLGARLEATQDLTFDYTLDYNNTHDTPNPATLTYATPGGIYDGSNPFGAYAGGVHNIGTLLHPYNVDYGNLNLFQFLQPNTRPNSVMSNGSYNQSKMFEDDMIVGHTFTITYNLDDVTLKSISAYRKLDWQNSIDLDGTPLAIAQTNLFNHYHQGSEELQANWQSTGPLGHFNWTTGLYYFTDGGGTHNPQEFNLGVYTGGEFYQDPYYRIATSAYAAYGQMDYVPPIFDDKLTLTGGLRYSNESERGSRVLIESFPGFGLPAYQNIALVPPFQDTHSWDAVTPTAIIKYNVEDNLNAYIKYAEGFKSGGFNLEAPTYAETKVPFDPETVDEFEIGAKGRFYDNRLSVNADAYWDIHNNMQLSVFTPTSGTASVVRNAGAANIRGIEADFEAIVIPDRIKVNGGFALMKATYSTFINDNVNVADNRAFIYAPSLTGNLTVDGTIVDADWGKLHLIADYQHIDPFFLYPYALTGVQFQDSAYSVTAQQRDLLNLRLQLSDIKVPYGTADVQLWVKNLTNEGARISGIPFGSAFGGLTTSYYEDPLTFGMTMRYHF